MIAVLNLSNFILFLPMNDYELVNFCINTFLHKKIFLIHLITTLKIKNILEQKSCTNGT